MAAGEGRVGYKKAVNGVTDTIRLATDTAQMVSAAHHANVEAALTQKAMLACTGASGVAPGTALSTTPPFTLYNPQGSGVYLAVVKILLGYISGTLGKGSLVLAGNPSLSQAAPTGGTALTVQNALLGYTAGKGLAYQGATLAATPTLLLPVFTLGAWVGSADTVLLLESLLNGSVVLAPGTSLSLQGIAAAGSSPLVLLGMLWEEVPA